MSKLTILLLIGILRTSFAAFTCDPDGDCQIEDTAGAKVPDVNDCEKYYLCITSTDGSFVASTIPLSCPIGSYFNQTVKGCVPGTGPCVNECRTKGVCNTTCPDPVITSSYTADKYDCSKYTLCSTEIIINVTCDDPTPYFNGVKCVDNPVQCCDFCTPYCLDVGLEIQDPCDCTSFYVCRNKGKPSDNTRGTCPAGTFYDETTNNCVAGSCTSLCSGEGCVVALSTTTSSVAASSSTTSSAFN